MIGQNKLFDVINKYIDKFPRFSIITGSKGCGKKTICKEIAKKLNLKPVMIGIKIEDVRNVIDMAYTQFDPILYIIADADNMSIAAKNSLLKITEEPPKSSYFMMTLQNIDNTLPTIRSRGVVFTLDPCSKEELIEYRKYRGYQDSFDNIITFICNNTGQVDELFSYDITDFYNFTSLVVDNIQVPVNGNAFKLTQKLKIKETDKGFDVNLFLRAVEALFYKKGLENKNKLYLQASIKTAEAIRSLRSTMISKQGVIDLWIMDVRAILRGL